MARPANVAGRYSRPITPSRPGDRVVCQDYFKAAVVQSGEEISLGFNPPYLAGDSLCRQCVLNQFCVPGVVLKIQNMQGELHFRLPLELQCLCPEVMTEDTKDFVPEELYERP